MQNTSKKLKQLSNKTEDELPWKIIEIIQKEDSSQITIHNSNPMERIYSETRK